MGTNQKIKVCHLISGDLWAGAEVQVHTLLASLESVPYLNLSAIILNEEKLAEELRKAGLEVTVIEEAKHNFFKILNLIEKELKDKEIDILHTHRYKENVLGGLLKRKHKIKFLVQTVHGIQELLKGIKKLKINLYSYLDDYFTRNYFDKVLAVSFDIKEKLSRKMDSGKLVTIHNAVDTSHLKATRTPNEVRKDLKIGESQPIIGSAGRMVPIKGYEVLLEAAKIILRKKPEVRILMTGDGPSRGGLEKKAKELGLEAKVIFLGFREDIIDIMNCFDIFLLSSYHEGIPVALLEAMALKKAVVATGVGGIKEIVEDNVSGLLVSSGDPTALALACLKVLDNPELRKNLESAARKRVEEEFSIEIQKNRVLRLYRELMRQL